MSGTPTRRLNDEGGGGGGSGTTTTGHSSSSKYDSGGIGIGPKLTSAALNSASFEMGVGGQDARMIPRDARLSPVLPMYRMPPSSSNDLHSFDNVRDSKDGNGRDRDGVKVENKPESKEVYQGMKGELGRVEGKGDVSNKDGRPDAECKGDAKMEMDVYGTAHLNANDSKEHHRVKRNSDAPTGMVDPWHAWRANLYAPLEGGKEGGSSTQEKERVSVEANEAVGENKVDMKAEDKFKEKERKRKEGKHREWTERDRRNNLQVGSASGENKESTRDDREAERSERERKDLLKDKEKPREREKDHFKKEGWNGIEKGILHNDKEKVDASGRTLEQENSMSEQKKQKDNESWKNVDREARERRRERDADVEGERPEKRSRCFDKESDDGCVDAEGGTEKEREAFNYGVQQRKRMLRPRGSPQMANREPRFRPLAQDNEGSQGKSEVSTVVYRVGECMQELIKLWKEYESSRAEKNCESSQNGPTLEIRIPAEHVTATNRQVRGGQLWGTDVYTDDSDLVAVLMHTGYCRPTTSPPSPTIQELRATIRVLPPQDCYISTLRNNVRSRAWGAAIGCSYRVERCCIVKKGGGTIDLEPCLTNTSSVEPTLAPVAVERTMTTRAAASNALRQQRFVREVTIQYNLCNEPWIKYSINIVADKGLKKPLYTSARLKKGEVLYLETHSRRYELCFTGEKMVKAHETEADRSQTHNHHSSNGEISTVGGDSVMIDVFRWSRCKKPLPQKVMRSIGIPLPLEHLEVLQENLNWEDILWSQTGVTVAGKEYPLARVHFLSPN